MNSKTLCSGTNFWPLKHLSHKRVRRALKMKINQGLQEVIFALRLRMVTAFLRPS